MARARVLIVGGGFGGFHAAKALIPEARADVLLVDRRNHHLFQPLLYQVASAVLSPGEIAMPLRTAFRRAVNVTTVMTEITSIDLEHRLARAGEAEYAYDFLILAAGSDTGYGPHESWGQAARGLKTLDDAIVIRQRLLLAFEEAERATDPAARRRLLSFAIVGGGPTGVELAGAFAEIATLTLCGDFRRTDLRRDVSISLIERGPRLLPGFPERASAYAQGVLAGLGVRVMTDTSVQALTPRGVATDGGFIPTSQTVWAAGVKPAALASSIPGERDHHGRIVVLPDLSLPGHPEVFIVGDLASVAGASGETLPALAPVAVQQGRHAVRNISAILSGHGTTPFRYRDRGTMAVLGRSRAVARISGRSFAGRLAWLLWLVVHVRSLSGFENRLLVLTRWVWAYAFSQRGARLIYGRLSVDSHVLDRAHPSPEPDDASGEGPGA